MEGARVHGGHMRLEKLFIKDIYHCLFFVYHNLGNIGVKND